MPEYAGQKDQVKFPGGGNKSGEVDFFSTLKRELTEETGLSFKADVEPRIIHRVSRRNDQDKTKLHLQVFYFVPFESLQGTLRTEEIVDGTSVLSAPFWVSVNDIRRSGFLYWTHYIAMQKTMNYIIIAG